MPITVCVRMLYVWVCVQACVKSNSLIPLMLPFGEKHPTKTTGRALYCSVNDARLASLALHIEALCGRGQKD